MKQRALHGVTRFLREAAQAAALVLLQLVGPGAGAWAAPLPVSAELGVGVGASMGADSDFVDDVIGVSFPTTETLTFEGEALASDGRNFSRAYESVSATFGAYEGSVVLDFGVEIVNPDRLGAHAQLFSHDAWSYTFIPDADGALVFDYAFGGVGSLLFSRNSQAGEALFGSGSIRLDLVADEPYTIGLYLHAGPSCFGACDGYSASGSGSFVWSIVPEPSTFSCVASGLLALALGRRAPSNQHRLAMAWSGAALLRGRREAS